MTIWILEIKLWIEVVANRGPATVHPLLHKDFFWSILMNSILFQFQVAYQIIQSGQHYQNHHSEHNAWYDSLNCVTSCGQEVIYWPFVGGQFVPRPKNSYYILHHTLDNDENRRNDRDGLFSSLRYRISNFMGQIAKPLFSRSWNLQFESTRIRLLYARSIVVGFGSNRQGQ